MRSFSTGPTSTTLWPASRAIWRTVRAAVDQSEDLEPGPAERDRLLRELLGQLRADIEVREHRLDRGPGPDDVLDRLDDGRDVGGPLGGPRRGRPGGEVERSALEAHQVEADVDEADVERMAVLDRAGVVSGLAGAEAAGRRVERAVTVGALHDEGAGVACALDQTEDLGQRKRVECSLETHSSPGLFVYRRFVRRCVP